MANPFDEAILEGFICPSCMKSFDKSSLLQHHFLSEHSSLRYANACNQTAGRLAQTKSYISTKSYAYYHLEPQVQPLGIFRSLFDEFNTIRRNKVNWNALEVNSLLIRLEKLFAQQFSEESERRAHEQSVVPWVEINVKLCPSCGASFGFGLEFPEEDYEEEEPKPLSSGGLRSYGLKGTHMVSRLATVLLDTNPTYRRRHHCRLCGCVLCADCSYFISEVEANHLLMTVQKHAFKLYPTKERGDNVASLNSAQTNDGPPLSSTGFLRRTDSLSSLTSLSSSRNKPYLLRTCWTCKSLLEKKLQKAEERIEPSYVSLHTELRELMNQVTEAVPTFEAMATSLHSGEGKFSLEMAKDKRYEILEKMQKIDKIGRHFDTLSTTNKASGSLNFSSQRLCRCIGRLARRFVQDNLAPLRVLPTEQQFTSLAAQRKDIRTAQWLHEEQSITQVQETVSQRQMSPPSIVRGIRAAMSSVKPGRETGGGGDAMAKLNNLAQQIDIVSERLMNAKEANRIPQATALAVTLARLESQFKILSRQLQSNPLQ